MFFLLAKRRHFSQVDGASALVVDRVRQGSYGLLQALVVERIGQGSDGSYRLRRWVLQTSDPEMKVAKPS